MRPRRPELVGTTLGPYHVVSVLGTGAMGVVYGAEQAPHGRPVALKVLHEQLEGDPSLAARFLREARVSCALRNPNTVTVYDFGQSPEGRLYIAMERIDGQNLGERLRERGPFDLSEAATIGMQIARSLAE